MVSMRSYSMVVSVKASLIHTHRTFIIVIRSSEEQNLVYTNYISIAIMEYCYTVRS